MGRISTEDQIALDACDLTTVEGFSEYMRKRSEIRIALQKSKNHDYANPDKSSDSLYKVFKNFMMVELRGTCKTEIGLMVRIEDEYAQFTNLMNVGHRPAVDDESLMDTILDLQNYLDILSGYMDLKQRVQRRRDEVPGSI